jgi:hypothetical protein
LPLGSVKWNRLPPRELAGAVGDGAAGDLDRRRRREITGGELDVVDP